MGKLTWQKYYELLKQYLEEYNGKYPKRSDQYKGVNIGVWVNVQRVIYNNGVLQEDGTIRYGTSILTKEKIEKLNEINFLWNSNTDEFNWLKKYELLKEYLEENNGEYPKNNEIYKKEALGQWVVEQRLNYNNGVLQEDGTVRYGTRLLTKEQIDKLNEIRFLKSSNISDYKWDEKYELLKEYLKEHNGHYPKTDCYYKYVALGRWVNRNQQIYDKGELQEDGSYKYGSNILTQERIEKLNKIGFIWILYSKKDYKTNINNKERLELIQRKVLYRLKKVLEDSKNEIESKEDIDIIEKEFVKSLTMFD